MSEQLAVTIAPRPRRKLAKVRGVFERPRGSNLWWVRYHDAAGRERREKAGTRGMALALLDKRRMERRQQIKLPETMRRKPVTVREVLDLADRHAREHFTSLRQAKGGATEWRYPLLAAEFGSLDAAALTPQRIEHGLAKLAGDREWSPATCNRYRDFLSLGFKLAQRNGLVPHNPVRLLARRREDNGRVRFLSQKEETRLRAVIQAEFPEHEPEFDLALHTGMRQGNQCRLRWADVDFERKQITIARAKNGRPLYLPISSAALAALLRLKAMAGDSPYVVLNRNTRGRGVGKPPLELGWFNRAVAKAGLKDVCWHTLRHTFASRAVMAGLDIRVVADLLGHRTLAMAMRYSHLAPQHRLDAVEKIAAAFPVQTGTRTGTGDSEPFPPAAVDGRQTIAVQ